jgi:hypothetical protein
LTGDGFVVPQVGFQGPVYLGRLAAARRVEQFQVARPIVLDGGFRRLDRVEGEPGESFGGVPQDVQNPQFPTWIRC